MTETITLDNELKVGAGWRFQCWKCNRQVKIDKPFPKVCPGCGAGGSGGWWGHLVTPNNGQRVGDDVKNSEVMMPGGIKTRDLILSQLPDAVVYRQRQNRGVYGTTQGRRRGRPSLTVPEDLIMELSGQGFSSRAMVGELDKRGFKNIGYKTIQRRLQATLL